MSDDLLRQEILSHLEVLDRDQLAELGELAEGMLRLLDVHDELAGDEKEG